MADFLREGGVTRLSRLTDGRVMCCLCFEYKTRDELAPVEDYPELVWDMCKPCKAMDEQPCCRFRDHGIGGCACPEPKHAGDAEHPFAERHVVNATQDDPCRCCHCGPGPGGM